MTTPTYETDFCAWTQAQAAALRDGKWDTPDWANLAEEIESLGRSERYAIESHLQNLLTHLLKWRYDPATEPRRGLADHDPQRAPRHCQAGAWPPPALPRAVFRHRLSPRSRGRGRRIRPAPDDVPRGLPVAGGAGTRCRLLAGGLIHVIEQKSLMITLARSPRVRGMTRGQA